MFWNNSRQQNSTISCLVQKMNNSLEITENVLLSIPKTFVALTAALSQYKEGLWIKLSLGLFSRLIQWKNLDWEKFPFL